MDDPVIIRLLAAAGFALVGVLCLLYSAWARAGRSARARRWMGNEFGSTPNDERMTVLGLPGIGLMCFGLAAVTIPRIGLYLAVIGAPLLLLGLATLFLALMLFIPLPDAIYPRWARPLRQQRREQERAMKAWLRER